MVPAAVLACNVTEPGPQLVAGVVDEIEGIAFIVATTAVLGEEVQPLLVTSA